MSNLYVIQTLHTVYNNDYENGEGEVISNFADDVELLAASLDQAIEKYFADHAFYNYDKKFADIDDGILNYTVTTDDNDDEATEEQLIEWKSGKLDLYYHNIRIKVGRVNWEDMLCGA